MKRTSILPSLLIAAIFVHTAFSDQSCIIRIDKPSAELYARCFEEGRDIASYIPGKQLDLVVAESEVAGFIGRSGPVRVLETAADINRKRTMRNGRLLPAGYMTYDEMVQKLQSYVQQYPQICKLYDLGDSHGKTYTGADYANFKHDIWALKVSDNVEQNEAEPKFYFMGAHHARETASMDVCMAVLEHLLSGYATDQAIAGRVNNSEIWFIPQVNPDGCKIALSDTAYNMWRKNIRDNNTDGKISYETQTSGKTGSTYDGVDLNRNYSYHWGTSGTTPTSSFETYCGPSAFSEPEIACLKPLLEEQRFVAGISYHLYSELVLWPYASRPWFNAPDSASLGDLGRKIAAKLPKRNGGTYTAEKASDLYAASGSTDDYVYSQHGTFGYTIELFDNSFWPAEAEVQKLKQDNKVMAMEFLNRATYSCVTGCVTTKATGGAVEAQAYVKEIDDTVATKTSWRGPVMNNKATGFYMRLLLPGTYTITFRPKDPGFKDTTISGVVVHGDKVTTLNIQYGASTGILSPGIRNPEGVMLLKSACGAARFLLPAGKRYVRSSLFSANGRRIGRFSIEPGQSGFEIRTASLSRGLYLIRFEGDGYYTDASFMIGR